MLKLMRSLMQRYLQSRPALLLLVLGQLFAQAALASDVYLKVDDNEFGQGILRQRGAECLIVTPAHVVENALKIEMTIADRSKHSAEVLELFPGDIGVLRLNGDQPSVCRHASWSDAVRLDALLENEQQGELRTMLADGSIRITPVDIVAFDKYRSIHVRPRNKEDAISKGESGSLLYISGQLSGMLLSIRDGIGNVIRQDALTNTLALFFGEGGKNGKQGMIQPSRVTAPKPPPPEKSSTSLYEFAGVIANSAVAEHRIKLEENSPVRLSFSATGDREKFIVEIMDSTRRVVHRNPSKRYGGTETFNIPFTAPRNDIYSINILGAEGEGRYAVKIFPIAWDAQLRNEANVLQAGGSGTAGVLAKGAVAEYQVKLEANSPVRLQFSPAGDEMAYNVEILDATRKVVYREPSRRYSGTETVRLPFTAPKSGTYYMHIIGAEGEGRFALRLFPIAWDAQLRSEANVIQVGGGAVEGIIAKGAVAEYRINLEANRPIRMNFSAAGGDGKFKAEIFDSTGKAVYQDPYKRFCETETGNIPFTASRSDTYSLRITGTEGEVRYAVSVM